MRSLNSLKDELWSTSTTEIFCKSTNKWIKQPSQKKTPTSAKPIEKPDVKSAPIEYRENEMNIQMLSKTLFQQIFNEDSKKIDNNLIKRLMLYSILI